MQWPAPSGLRAEDVFPADWIIACTERSLEKLGLETIDVQQLHVWSAEWLREGGDRATLLTAARRSSMRLAH